MQCFVGFVVHLYIPVWFYNAKCVFLVKAFKIIYTVRTYSNDFAVIMLIYLETKSMHTTEYVLQTSTDGCDGKSILRVMTDHRYQEIETTTEVQQSAESGDTCTAEMTFSKTARTAESKELMLA